MSDGPSAPTHWPLFDAHTVIGRHVRWTAGGLHSADELLAEMDHYGLAEALVLDCLSREMHPLDGNRRVLEACAGSPRLHPAWVALPPGTDEQPEPAELVEDMRRHGVGALWLLPQQYRYRLSDWCLDPLLEPLAAARVPVFVSFVEVGPQGAATDACEWEQVIDLCRRWPDLPVVLSEHRIRRGQRMLYRAFDACPNLRLELSCYWLNRGIEYVTARWGAERLLFGSGWPAFGQHMTLATLTRAEIDDRDKELIAGDNLRRLSAWCGPEHAAWQPPEAADEYVGCARAGWCSSAHPPELPEPIWDCHGHLGGRFSHYHLPDASLEATVAEMDRQGVAKVCVFSFAGVSSDERYGNDVVAEAVAAYPERFVGFTMVNPHRGPDEMWRELERGASLGLRGVKLIPHYQGYPPEGPNIDPACLWAHERRQLILNHHWGSAEQVERLVSTYSEACFLTGHTTTAYAEVMHRHANLYVCSCPLLDPRACENVVAAIGAERFLFGSDLQDLPIAWGLGPILFARVRPAEKRLILGGNLRRLLESYSLDP